MADPTLKAIFKYKDHTSILAVQSYCEKETFRFWIVLVHDTRPNNARSNEA